MLAKSGDILSVLPCLQQEFRETGVKPTLIVAKAYSALPKALPWLNVEEYDGNWEQLGSALKWAKSGGKVDFVPQQHSTDSYQPVRRFPSFQYQQWHAMGRLHQWGLLPLEISRGAKLHFFERPAILVADHSQSSPFSAIDDLVAALKQTFPGHQVMRLSSIRLASLLDFLALYDASDLLISIDTAHAHLAKASKVPFIMLATDVPSLWYGSAFHPRMSLHVRYSDYPLRKSELLWTVRNILTVRNQKANLMPA
jgi:hypothetical protein